MHKEGYAKCYRNLLELQGLGYNVVISNHVDGSGTVHIVKYDEIEKPEQRVSKELRDGEYPTVDTGFHDAYTGLFIYEKDCPHAFEEQDFMDEFGFINEETDAEEARVESVNDKVNELTKRLDELAERLHVLSMRLEP